MATRTYAVRNTPDQTIWTTPLSLSKTNSTKKITLVTLLSFIGCLFGFLFLFRSTYAASAPFWCNLLWILSGSWLVYLLIMPSDTYAHGWSRVKPMIEYQHREARRLNTTNTSRSNPVATFYGYGLAKNKRTKEKLIITNDGYVWLNNKSIMKIVEVEGNASQFVSANVLESIINSMRDFYLNIPENVETHIVTNQANQRIVMQLKNAKEQLEILEKTNQTTHNIDNLIALQKEKIRILEEYVGESFKTLRQFIVITADDSNNLQSTLNLMFDLVNYNGSTAFRRIRPLDNPDEIMIWLHNQNCSLSQQQDYDIQLM